MLFEKLHISSDDEKRHNSGEEKITIKFYRYDFTNSNCMTMHAYILLVAPVLCEQLQALNDRTLL